MERTIRVDAADYLSRALAEIDDLTGDTREDLKDSIESAVIEVAAEFPDDLELLLGPPERFVAELRVAAGLESEPSGPLRRGGMVGSWTWLAGRLRSIADPHSRDRIRRFISDLRPAWWVARGYGWAVLVGLITSGTVAFDWYLLLAAPSFWWSPGLSLPVLVGLIWASIQIGRRDQLGVRDWRTWAVNLVALVMLIPAGTTARHEALIADDAIRGVFEPIDVAEDVHPGADAPLYLMEDGMRGVPGVGSVPIRLVELFDEDGRLDGQFEGPDLVVELNSVLFEMRDGGRPAVAEVVVHTAAGTTLTYPSIESLLADISYIP